MELQRNDLPHFQPGACIENRYRIAALIGQGGMGRVYLAEDLRLQGKLRALKLTAALPGDRDAFIREASLLSSLSHPLLPGIVDYIPPDKKGWAIIVMDYIPGETLSDLFVRGGRQLPYMRIRNYLEQLCEVLCYLHAQRPQIVFRDLKPANVMIDHHDRAILVDFGIARSYRPEAKADTERLGTPAFAAPEQITGCQTDARSDLYSWGALAYYLLSGGQAAYRQTTGRRARQLQADVPAAFRDLLDEVLSEEPTARPQSASELLARLRQPTAEATEFADDPRRFVDRRIDNNRSTGVAILAVMSAYPGAGATLAALGLSQFLTEQGMHHAVVECSGGEPELFALLNGGQEMPEHAVFADPSGAAPATPAWRRKKATYYPLDPQTPAGNGPPNPSFAVWLRRLGVPVVLLDVSSSWHSPGMPEFLAACSLQSIWWVADCLPVKWTPRLQRLAADLQAKVSVDGTAMAGWIANRDHGFAQRSDWLSCFPAPPVACLPWLPASSVVRAVWRGEGYPVEGLTMNNGRGEFAKWAQAAAVVLTT